MSKKNVPYSKRKDTPPQDYTYQIHGGTIAPSGYFKILVGKTLKHIITYNRHNLESARLRAKRLANESLGHVVSGSEFCS